MPLTAAQQSIADAIAANGSKFVQEIRSPGSTDLNATQKALCAAIVQQVPNAGQIATAREFIALIRDSGYSSSLSAAQIALAGGVRTIGRGIETAIRSGGNKSFISAADLTFLGGFNLPQQYPLTERSVCYGLTHRYRSGNFRLLSAIKGDSASGTAGNVHLVEFSVPGLSLSRGSYSDATPTTTYPQFWSSIMQAAGTQGARSIYWDEPSQKLYTASVSDYEATGTSRPYSRCTLDDVTPANSTHEGKFRLSTISYKAQKGVCAIPAAAQARLGDGKRLAFGFGGYESAINTGPAHMGPALVAMNPDLIDGFSDGAEIGGGEVLMSHPNNDTPYTSPFLGLRDTNYRTNSGFSGWNPSGGVGYFCTYDWIDGGCVWIETATKKGVLVFPTLSGNGSTGLLDGSFTPQFVSKTGDADGDIHVYDIRTTTPVSTWVGGALWVGNPSGNYNYCVVDSITNGGLDLRISITVGSQQGGNPPYPTTDIFSGVSYFEGTISASMITTTMICYDPEDLYTHNTNPMPFVTCESFVGPYGQASTGGFVSSPARIMGSTFDETTGRLYLLSMGGYVGVWQLSE